VADSPNKKPKVRRTGQRETIVAGKKYRLRVFLVKDAHGKKHYHSETFHGSAGQAEDRIREIIRRHRAGEAIKANAETFGSFLDEWLVSKKLAVAESTLDKYNWVVEKHIRPAFGKRLLAAVTADDVERLYAKLHADGSGRSFIRYIHTILGMVFKLAIQRKKLMGSPMVGVAIPKEWAESDDAETKAQAMTSDQVAKFLKAAAGRDLENLFKIAFHVGFRPGELLALKWANLDTEAKTLRLTHNIVFRKADDWYLKMLKTRSSRRTLPLTDPLIDVLKDQRRRQLEARLRAGKMWADHGFIFTDTTGEPYSQKYLYKESQRILKTAGFSGFSPYSIRHTMASLLLAAKANPKAVQERLGHARITTTLQVYAHVLPGEQAEVSAEIERLLKGKK
jgi:integrase